MFVTDVSITVSNSTVPPSINIDIMAEDLLCICAGDPIRIPATIKGRPVPKVTWDFDGKAKSHKKNKLHTLPVDSEVRLNTTTQQPDHFSFSVFEAILSKAFQIFLSTETIKNNPHYERTLHYVTTTLLHLL